MLLLAVGTQLQYRYIISQFEKWMTLRGKSLMEATDFDAVEYVEWVTKRPGITARGDSERTPVTAYTAKHKIGVLKGFYDHLYPRSLDNPFVPVLRKLKFAENGEKRPTVAVPECNVAAILSVNLGTPYEVLRNRALACILFGGGLRICEALRAKISDVREESREEETVAYLRMPKTKSRKVQEQVLPNWAAVMLHRYILKRVREGAQPDDPIFVRYNAEGDVMCTLSYGLAKKTYNRMCRLAEAGDFTPHSARATAITVGLENGWNILEAQKFARHTHPRTTEIYDKRAKDHFSSPGRSLEYPPLPGPKLKVGNIKN